MYLALKERFPSVAYKWMDRAVEMKAGFKNRLVTWIEKRVPDNA